MLNECSYTSPDYLIWAYRDIYGTAVVSPRVDFVKISVECWFKTCNTASFSLRSLRMLRKHGIRARGKGCTLIIFFYEWRCCSQRVLCSLVAQDVSSYYRMPPSCYLVDRTYKLSADLFCSFASKAFADVKHLSQRTLKSESLWRWCIVKVISFLDIFHRPDLSKTRCFGDWILFHHQVKLTVLGPTDRASPYPRKPAASTSNTMELHYHWTFWFAGNCKDVIFLWQSCLSSSHNYTVSSNFNRIRNQVSQIFALEIMAINEVIFSLKLLYYATE